MKASFLGIFNLIELSILPMEFNSRVSTALLANWSPTLNCFMLLEGSLTVTLKDVYFLTGCSPFRRPLRLRPKEDNKCEFANHRIF